MFPKNKNKKKEKLYNIFVYAGYFFVIGGLIVSTYRGGFLDGIISGYKKSNAINCIIE